MYFTHASESARGENYDLRCMIPADACQLMSETVSNESNCPVLTTYLVTRKNEGISNYNILPSSGREDHDLSDIVASQWLDAPNNR